MHVHGYEPVKITWICTRVRTRLFYFNRASFLQVGRFFERFRFFVKLSRQPISAADALEPITYHRSAEDWLHSLSKPKMTCVVFITRWPVILKPMVLYQISNSG